METKNVLFENKSFSSFDFIDEFNEILNLSIKEFDLKTKIPLHVDLLFVTRFKLKKLNNLHRQKNYATDVLSFPFLSDDLDFLEYLPIGQIIICPYIIKKHAKEFNHSVKREYCYMFAHGVAHLLGYDHQTEEEAKVMNEHVENIMTKMNIKR